MDMRNVSLRRWLIAAVALMSGSFATAQTAVRISEIHYDNTGADTGESIEVSAPAGTNLDGWSVVLYNGSGGASYGTLPLSGFVAANCLDRGVVVLPATGLQNGAPDGIALIEAGGAVVEFISYEGTFAATAGPANGVTSTDIVAFQNGNGPVGESLQRNAAGTWSLATSTFGACNDNGNTNPPAEIASVSVSPTSGSVSVGGALALSAAAFDVNGVAIANPALSWLSTDPAVATVSATGVVTGVAVGDVSIIARAANGIQAFATVTVNPAQQPNNDFRINEIHYDNAGADGGEAIEIEGAAGASLEGLTLVLYNGNNGAPYNTSAPLSGEMPTVCGNRGVVVVNYPADGIQNGAPDGIALVNSQGQVIEFLSYEGSFTAVGGPANGMVSTDIVASQNNAGPYISLQRNSAGIWRLDVHSFYSCNPETQQGGNSLSFSGRNSSDPALPVGYEDQLFATLRGPGNETIPTTITWSSETPAIASVDQNGVLHALAAGTAIVRATAADGTTDTYSLPTHVAPASTTAQYANNAEFGEPTDADASDDYIVRRTEYTSSYNPNRGGPNWVAYEIDPTHFGSEDRCDCFTMDPELPASFTQLTTADYTGAGAFHGYGIDRGHLARSFDRTSGALDNATTFLFSNIIPQAADQNQGPWSQLEFDLGDYARLNDREVYVIAGAYGNKGTIKNEGKLVIPTHTWKVALVLPRDKGLADIRDYRDVLETIAIIMPNEPGIRNDPWQNYRVTVDDVEAASGYDLLALLADDVEAAIESGTTPPIASIAGPAGAIAEGDSVTLSGAGSLDPNGTIVSYSWTFGDGSAQVDGVTATHTYAQDGAYTVTLTVTDDAGYTDAATFIVTVNNVAPTVGAVPNGAVNVGAAYTVTGSFSDPGADAWNATVDWGDGSAVETASVSGGSFSLTHTYAAAGDFTVSIAIADDDASTAVTHTVGVVQPAATLADSIPLIDGLVASRKLQPMLGAILEAEVLVAQRLIQRGNYAAAVQLLRGMVLEADLMVHYRLVKAADIAPVRAIFVSGIAGLGG
jgi:DNA/RNA endonuclease G (NUC1)